MKDRLPLSYKGLRAVTFQHKGDMNLVKMGLKYWKWDCENNRRAILNFNHGTRSNISLAYTLLSWTN